MGRVLLRILAGSLCIQICVLAAKGIIASMAADVTAGRRRILIVVIVIRNSKLNKAFCILRRRRIVYIFGVEGMVILVFVLGRLDMVFGLCDRPRTPQFSR